MAKQLNDMNNWYVIDAFNNIIEKFRLSGAARLYIGKNKMPGCPLYLIKKEDYDETKTA